MSPKIIGIPKYLHKNTLLQFLKTLRNCKKKRFMSKQGQATEKRHHFKFTDKMVRDDERRENACQNMQKNLTIILADVAVLTATILRGVFPVLPRTVFTRRPIPVVVRR